MSHIDTFRNFRKTGLILAFGLLFNLQAALAVNKCESLFYPKPGYLQTLKNIFSKKPGLQLTENQVLELTEFMGSDLNIKPYGLGRGTHDPLFMYIWSLIPQQKKLTISFLFENSPPEFKKFRMAISEVLVEHKLGNFSSSTFLELLLNNWGEHLFYSTSKKSFSAWVSQLELQHTQRLNSGEISLHELKTKFELGVSYKVAGTNWQNIYGVNELPIKFENSQHQVLVNGSWLKAQIDKTKKSIRILAPRNMVGRAAWNPLSSAVLQAKIANGHRQLSQYPAFLATNGTFYLSDGNHRFALDARPEVWLEMSYPAKTSSMSVSFDAIGIPQPSIEKQLSFFNKEITLEDLVAPAIAERILYR